jgi:very-short-patch-repair endonuclease
MWQTADRTRRARALRRELTIAEARFWDMVRDRRFDGLKFRREAPVAGFVVDFFCAELKLVVELDGGVHRLREAEDGLRDERLTAAGCTVLRSGNEAFLSNPNALLTAIRRQAARVRPASPSSDRLRRPPSPPRGEG